jgi:hypothetical protein
LDFNGVVAEIRRAAAQACGEMLGCVLRAVERRAQVREPDRWVNRGQATRRLRLPWGELAVTLPYRAACHWWQRLTGLRSSVMNFWRMVQQAGQRLVDREQEESYRSRFTVARGRFAIFASSSACCACVFTSPSNTYSSVTSRPAVWK